MTRRVIAVITALSLCLLLTAWVKLGRDTEITVTFARSVGLYQGDDVRILGVPVGEVSEIEATAQEVRVTLTIDSAVPIAADASAAIVAPSLVSGRYIQLAPAWTSGPRLASGESIPIDRTAVPIEWDELTWALNQFSTDLGAKPGKKSGPLDKAIDTAARNLDGQGADIRATLDALSGAISVLSDSRSDISTTVNKLAEFSEMLVDVDAETASFIEQSALVSKELRTSRTQMASVISELNKTLPKVNDYLKEDRPLLAATIADLNHTADFLTTQRTGVADLLQVAPTSLANLYQIYDPRVRTTTGAMALPYFPTSIGQVMCWLIQLDPLKNNCKELLPILDLIGPPNAQAAEAQRTAGGRG